MEHLREKILAYVETLDDAIVGPQTIFRKQQSKSDLETTAWKLDHKLRAANYHADKLTAYVDRARTSFSHSAPPPELPNGATFRSEVIMRDDRVPFEIEAFFGAGRSALDYFAQIVSRYVRGCDFSSMRNLGKFAVKRTHTAELWAFLGEEWDTWISSFIDYRDDVVHYVVSKTAAASTSASTPSGTFAQSASRVETRELLFPVPRKLDRAMSISRCDILGLDPGMGGNGAIPSNGVIRTEVSGSMTVDGVLIEEWNDAGYMLMDGYVSADELVEEFNTHLSNLIETALTLLTNNGFVHVPHDADDTRVRTPSVGAQAGRGPDVAD